MKIKATSFIENIEYFLKNLGNHSNFVMTIIDDDGLTINDQYADDNDIENASLKDIFKNNYTLTSYGSNRNLITTTYNVNQRCHLSIFGDHSIVIQVSRKREELNDHIELCSLRLPFNSLLKREYITDWPRTIAIQMLKEHETYVMLDDAEN